MNIEPIQVRSSIKKYDFLLEYNSSKPIKILCDDFKIYYCKTPHRSYKIKKVFNDFLCYFFLKELNINTPNLRIIKIHKKHLEGSIYFNLAKENDYVHFLGSELLQQSIEVLSIERKKSKNELNKYNIDDILKIAFFDFLFFNIDRKKENPNLLVKFADTNNLRFYAIDHGMCFNDSCDIGKNKNFDYCTNCLSPEESILNHNLIKALLRHNNKNQKIPEINFVNCADLNSLKNVFEFAKKEFRKYFHVNDELNWYDKNLNDDYFTEDWLNFSCKIFNDEIRTIIEGGQC